ncbi:hypothetical protein [Nocardioides sp. B-3]|uniref:hypothetical protein n=1 Tax=Nocardioides sp. B-3 TaxID=2895565 RepID=UPI002152E203|nr:hypothetical protein [Nocardioides sp. B-3]UUZ58435.1 hypothetical protein LP418_19935 [Nocardioides sp. B-3]
MIEGVNTVEGVKPTNVVATSIGPIDIADPDGIKSTGDETAGPVTLSVTFADMAFTASGTGPVSFREDTSPITPTPGPGLLMVANPGFNVQIRCSPGTVAGSEPGVVTLIDPAAAFAPTAAITPPTIPPTTLPTTPPTTPPTTTPTTTAPATTAPTTAAPTTTTPTTTPAPPAKQNTTTAAKAKYSTAKKKATVTVAVKGADGKPGTGSVKVTVKLGTKKIKTITAALSSSGVAKAVFKKIAAKGKYKVTVKYAGSATTNASSGKTTFKVA